MCVLALFLDPLIVAANRDEFRDRPSAPPGEIEPGIIGGRDLESGGTWLGVNRQGLFVAVVNRHRPGKSAKSWSRGLLALDALRCRELGEVEALVRKRTDERPLAGFNLVAATDREGACFEFDGSLRVKTLAAGGFVITTNRDLDDPKMPEKAVFDRLDPAPDETSLRDFLKSHEGERPICKHDDRYGTVSSTIYAGKRLLFAEGPPCRTEYRDCSRLLDS